MCIRRKEYKHAIQACNDILDKDPIHCKALYLRARALIEPTSAGTTEYKLAKKDLEQARNIFPRDPNIL